MGKAQKPPTTHFRKLPWLHLTFLRTVSMNDEQPTQSQDIEKMNGRSPEAAGVSLNGSSPESTRAADATEPTQAPEPVEATGAVETVDTTDADATDATEARDDQDAQMPGETDLVGADDAEPQIMQA